MLTLSMAGRKKLEFIGSSKKDLGDFPEDVEDVMGWTLLDLQDGVKRKDVKPLKGYGGAHVMEICENYDTDTYRMVVTVEYEEAIYVLHSYKKKSKKGSEVPKNDKTTIESRLKMAAEKHQAWLKERKEQK